MSKSKAIFKEIAIRMRKFARDSVTNGRKLVIKTINMRLVKANVCFFGKLVRFCYSMTDGYKLCYIEMA